MSLRDRDSRCFLRVDPTSAHPANSPYIRNASDRSSPGGSPMATRRPTLGSVSSDVNAKQRDQDNAGDNDAQGHEGRYQAGGNRR
jgi:hypothetical protein